MACAYSLSGKQKECLKWLEKAWQLNQMPTLSYITHDTDFDPVRSKEWFIEFNEKVKAERGY
jgi:hypothetical protein